MHKQYNTLLVKADDGVLNITLNRPECRNAMSLELLHEMIAVIDSVADSREIRAIVIAGAEGNFCAGGDIKDMAAARKGEVVDGKDPVAHFNRHFGTLMSKVNNAPQAVIAIIEGAVLGGGFGLCCVSDIALCAKDAQFGLPETGLGITPAQIAPFVVQRIGITQARRLGVTGGRFNGELALKLGLVHELFANEDELNSLLDSTLRQIKRCAPGANAATKQLMLRVGTAPMNELLDRAADEFAMAVKGAEGREGMTAFVEKRLPTWAE